MSAQKDRSITMMNIFNFKLEFIRKPSLFKVKSRNQGVKKKLKSIILHLLHITYVKKKEMKKQ